MKWVNCKKLFLVIDSSYPFLKIKGDIEALEMEKIFFSDFTPNPLYEQVCKGINLIRAEKCDTILAVGGGSAIDVAKCIKLAVLDKEGNAALIPPFASKRLSTDFSQIPFIAIPTTAGTGSESTHNAVIYYEGTKQTVTNDEVLPDYAILEPRVLKTLPLYQKKCTMMDALCQGIESWWSVNSTDESKAYSRKAVELILANWKAYIFDHNGDAAAHIMLAANYGGKAINISATTAAHAMSYKITSLYGLPHGHAVAVCLPEIWEYMLSNTNHCIDKRGEEYMKETLSEIEMLLNVTDFRNIMKSMELQNPVFGNREKELLTLITSINPIRLKNHPVVIDEETARFLYQKILRC